MNGFEKRRLICVLAIFACLIAVIFYCIKRYEFRIYFNTTNSLPSYVFIGVKPCDLSRGAYVVFEHDSYPNKNLIKRIEGLSGDEIHVGAGFIMISDKTFTKTFKIQSKRRDGKPLTPIQISRVPKDYYFVAGTNDSSYDSRYDEFGLISRFKIKGRVWPLF